MAPRLVLASVCLLHAPFTFPGTLAAEIAIHLIYRKVVFGTVQWRSLSFAANVISPAFYSPPEETEDAEPNVQASASFHLKHVVVLTVLVSLLVYLPAGLVMKLVLFRPFAEDRLAGILEALAWTVGCMALHGLSVLAYYQAGHNWKLSIQNSEQGRDARVMVVKTIHDIARFGYRR